MCSHRSTYEYGKSIRKFKVFAYCIFIVGQNMYEYVHIPKKAFVDIGHFRIKAFV